VGSGGVCQAVLATRGGGLSEQLLAARDALPCDFFKEQSHAAFGKAV